MSRSIRVTALAAMLVLVGCSGERVVDTDELEGQIAAELQAQTGVTPTSVSCPDDVPAEAGATFSCTVTADDGSTANVTVTQTDDEGSLTWEVDAVN
ncbi:MAG: DUF4333 domain-containing protein [Actinomycetota bacterium]